MACPLCGDRCTCSFTPTTGVGDSASSSLTYDYDDEYRPDEAPANVGAVTKTSLYPSEAFLAAAIAPDPVLDVAPVSPPEDLAFEPAPTR